MFPKIREVSFRNLMETMSGLCYVRGVPTIKHFSHNYDFLAYMEDGLFHF